MSETSSAGTNNPEYTVSEISNALKRTVETTFSHVRIRGELSKVTIAKSGHVYTNLKDESAVLDAVCWKGVASRLSVRPEEGLEVICTGRLSTYPGRSSYQLIIESMELAGEGALLKMLEERKKKLAAEGLFDPAHKQPIPFLPEVIGVVTSPTGAVIRDILHRLADRFPRHVLVWPVQVQGDGAAQQIVAGIDGFNALSVGGAIPRPDLLIVARGGGSLEDLMAFNEESVVRAAFNSKIPLISAVGHETDTTLIDYASDLRAPTPTAAAEHAVPVRAEVQAQVLDDSGRLVSGMQRFLEHHKTRVDGLGRGLSDPKRLLENAMQRLDDRADRLDLAIKGLAGRSRDRLISLQDRVSPVSLVRLIGQNKEKLDGMESRLLPSFSRRLEKAEDRLKAVGSLLESYSYKGVLARGFVLVTDDKKQPLTKASEAKSGMAVSLEFQDGSAEAVIGGKPTKTVASKIAGNQGSLF